jgi:hypothetical protein
MQEACLEAVADATRTSEIRPRGKRDHGPHRSIVTKLESFLPLVEPDALVRIASAKALKAGQDLFDKAAVSDIVFSGDSVTGKIKGSKPVPHTTTVKLEGKSVAAHCTCPTFVDGWEKFCHHAVALCLALRQQYRSGAEITTTQNPWVEAVAGEGVKKQSRYQIQQQGGTWLVSSFESGTSMAEQRVRTREGLHPADRLIQHYLDQEVDETDDGAHVLEDAALAGLLYFARDSSGQPQGRRQAAVRARAAGAARAGRVSREGRPASSCTRSSSTSLRHAASRSRRVG